MWDLNDSQPHEPPWPVTGMALLLPFSAQFGKVTLILVEPCDIVINRCCTKMHGAVPRLSVTTYKIQAQLSSQNFQCCNSLIPVLKLADSSRAAYSLVGAEFVKWDRTEKNKKISDHVFL
jgi:hypothetical protein